MAKWRFDEFGRRQTGGTDDARFRVGQRATAKRTVARPDQVQGAARPEPDGSHVRSGLDMVRHSRATISSSSPSIGQATTCSVVPLAPSHRADSLANTQPACNPMGKYNAPVLA